ncbi:MAG: glucose 1-dehydrogenase [Phycisphaerales bacterium]
MERLADKVVIVTGASKGIGAGIARAMAREGASVVVNYASSKTDADRVVEDIVGQGGEAIAVQADTSSAEDVERLFAESARAFGPVDVLVNNAGVFRFGPFVETTEESFHWHFNTNVLGPVLTTLAAVKQFGPSGGSVINISSVVGSHARPSATIYSSTKGALDTLTRALALELGERNIRVNAVAPGHTETEGTKEMFAGDVGAKLAAESPLSRLGQPSDIAAAVVFLASDDAKWITGEVLRASGGAI